MIKCLYSNVLLAHIRSLVHLVVAVVVFCCCCCFFAVVLLSLTLNGVLRTQKSNSPLLSLEKVRIKTCVLLPLLGISFFLVPIQLPVHSNSSFFPNLSLVVVVGFFPLR